MNAEVKEKWVAALKSGEYQQITGELKYRDGYCCLGVLCDLYIKESPETTWNTDFAVGKTDRSAKLKDYGELPPPVAHWAGLDATNPMFAGDYATAWNDDKCASFEEIAELIEEHL